MSAVDWFAPDWAPIPGYPGYEASQTGEIRSRRGGRLRVLRQRADRNGYRRVNVSVGGVSSTIRLHQAVLLAFRGPAPLGADLIRHLDGNPSHNALTNLAYGTRAENEYDKVLHGTHPFASRTHCKHGHEFTPENTRWRKPKDKRSRASRICRTCSRERNRARRAVA